MNNKVLAEAKHLYDLGFSIHWLHKKSKRPIESAWTSGPRKTWQELTNTYRDGMNVGVRLGETSKIGDNFLGVLDVDVKSTDPKHIKEVNQALIDLTSNQQLPEVKSGRGNGSKHYYILTPEPLAPFKALQSKDIVKVPMPSVKPSKRELLELTQAELEKGLRLRAAWEVGVMGQGQQVVLPPSVHPDSGKNYEWAKPFTLKNVKPFNVNVFNALKPKDEKVDKKDLKVSTTVTDKNVKFNFELEPVDLLTVPTSEKIIEMILTGAGVDDRSASLLPVATALVKAGLNQNQVLTVLTDPDNYLGQTGYHHAQTKNRMRAAAWVYKYTLKKVLKEKSGEALFRDIPESIPLTFDEMVDEDEAFDEDAWMLELDVTDKDKYRATVKNIIDILTHVVSNDFVRRDVFAFRDAYEKETPWGGEVGAAITDDDMIRIKVWLSRNWGFEASVTLISEAISAIAINNSYDPVIDWLESLPEWDGVDRLDTWLTKHFGAVAKTAQAEEYLAQVFRKWVFGMVLRAYKPGAHFSWMPIFEGAQGIGKSSFGRILVGEKYFLDWLPDLGDKDSSLALQGAWAVEMPELASMRKNEIEIVKAYMTRKVDKFRPPHGRKNIESPRRCVFFGTTNNATYLKDDSGNRRFKPIEVGELDFEQLAQDRDQLFAEALWLYRRGFESENTIELNGDAKLFEKTIQKEKMVQDESDLMAEEIRLFFEAEKQSKNQPVFDFFKFNVRELFSAGPIHFAIHRPLHQWRFDSRNVQFATKALKKLGGKKRHTKSGNIWYLDLNE